MKSPHLYLPVLLVVLLLAAGCTGTQQPVAPAPSQQPVTVVTTTPSTPIIPQDLAGSWVLSSLGIQHGTAITYPSTEITLTLNPDGTLTGYDGCNNYFGTYTLTGTTTPKGTGMTISGLGSTKKFCASLQSQEQQYLNILEKTAAYDIDGTTQLVLTGDLGDVLIYQRPGTLATPTVARGY
ncbi:MAG: META domain-containing protein [Methanomicrobiales archaeon]|nr:META domain-containing protein [Methanomicrobiales archaeon]